MSAAPRTPAGAEGHGPPSTVHRLVSASLNQPLLVLLFAVVVALAGIWSFSQLPVDAYPDLSPPMVDIITQWPGHAAEEVERLITVPLENEMNGVERLRVERSISLYGLSDISLTFTDETDPYFARQRVFERLPSASLPDGVDPEVEPLVVALGADLPLCARQPGPVGDGAQDHQRLGAGEGVQRRARGRRPVGTRRRDDGVPRGHRPHPAGRRGPRHRRRGRRRWAPTTPTPAAVSTPREGSSTTSAGWGAWRRSTTSARSS